MKTKTPIKKAIKKAPEKAPVKAPVVKEAPKGFTATLQHGTETFIGKGNTGEEAVNNIPRPVKIVTKGVITLTDGVKKNTKALFPLALKRLFVRVGGKSLLVKGIVDGLK